ncbi:hypothetical protein [uncultured Anaerovibrio sp.]|uniref:hypothetical protein n=1 Tax=uncultured Anaerovibrio sp. TaxID=361586 RepID=UPI002611C382|nr:hypothetical protein [uncultured Anaerovibrio sp.]
MSNTTFFNGGVGDPDYVEEKGSIAKGYNGISPGTVEYSKEKIDGLLKIYFEETEKKLDYASKTLKLFDLPSSTLILVSGLVCLDEDSHFRSVKANIFTRIIELDKVVITIEEHKDFLIDVLNHLNMGKKADEVSIQYDRLVSYSENIKDLFEKKLSGSLASSNEGIVKSVLNIPLDTAKGIADYLLVDQEKEAHEAAIYVATMRCGPVLQKIKNRIEKLKNHLARLNGDYEAQCDAIEKLFLQYKMDNKCLVKEIDNKRKESSQANKFITNLVNSGTIIEGINIAAGSGAVGSGAIGSGAVAATGATAGLASLATPLFIVSLIVFAGINLDKHNKEKYKEKYNLFYSEVLEKYQVKIDREKDYIRQYIKEIKNAKKINAVCLDELNKALNDEIQKYAQYNTIYTMIRRL